MNRKLFALLKASLASVSSSPTLGVNSKNKKMLLRFGKLSAYFSFIILTTLSSVIVGISNASRLNFIEGLSLNDKVFFVLLMNALLTVMIEFYSFDDVFRMRDRDQLFVLPVSERSIILSKLFPSLLTMLVCNLITNGILALFLVSLLTNAIGLFLAFIVSTVLLVLILLPLTGVLMFVVSYLGSNKNRTNTLMMVVFFIILAIYMAVSNIAMSSAVRIEKIIFLPLVGIADFFVDLNVIALIIPILLAVVLNGLFFGFIDQLINLVQFKTVKVCKLAKRASAKASKFNKRSLQSALFKHNLKLSAKNFNYIMTAYFFAIYFAIGAIVLYFTALKDLSSEFESLGWDNLITIGVILVFFLGACFNSNGVAINLEGYKFYIVRCAPIDSFTYLKMKIVTASFLSFVFTLPFVLCIAILYLHGSILFVLLALIVAAASSVLSATISLLLSLISHKLIDKQQVALHSGQLFIGTILCLLIAICGASLVFGTYLSLSFITPVIAVTVLLAYTTVLTGISLLYLKNNGEYHLSQFLNAD